MSLRRKLQQRKKGATKLEYALLIGLVTGGSIFAVSQAGTGIKGLFASSSEEFQPALTSGQHGGGTPVIPEGAGKSAAKFSWEGLTTLVAIVGENNTADVVLKNTGEKPSEALSATNFSISNPQVVMDTSACEGVLAGGASCAIHLTYTPTTAASEMADLGVALGALSESTLVSLQATWEPMAWTMAALSPGVVGETYSFTPNTPLGKSQTFTYAVSGALPAGLSFDSTTGQISGTPSEAGAFPVVITATSVQSQEHIAQNATLNTGWAAIAWTPPAPSKATVDQSYAFANTAATGVGQTFAYSVHAGSLPSGVSLDSTTGSFHGTPLQGGNFPITLRATSVQSGQFVDVATILAADWGAVTWGGSSTLPAIDAGAPYTAILDPATATGQNFTYAVVGGTLPTGLSLDLQTLTLSGTTSQERSGTFTVEATSAQTQIKQTKTFSYTSAWGAVAWSPASPLPAGTIGTAYTYTAPAATGSAQTFTYSLTGTLPSGLTFNAATRTLSGTPSAGGTYSLTLNAVSQQSTRATARSTTLNVSYPPMAWAPTTTLAQGMANTAYSATFTAATASGQTITYSTPTTTKSGITFTPSTRTFSGTPTTAGVITFPITATASPSNETMQNTFSIEVKPNPMLWSSSMGTPAAFTFSGDTATVKSGGPLFTTAIGLTGTASGMKYIEINYSNLVSNNFERRSGVGINSGTGYAIYLRSDTGTVEAVTPSGTVSFSGFALPSTATVGVAVNFSTKQVFLSLNGSWVGNNSPAAPTSLATELGKALSGSMYGYGGIRAATGSPPETFRIRQDSATLTYKPAGYVGWAE